MKLCHNVYPHKILASLNVNHVGSKANSLGQVKKTVYTSEDIFSLHDTVLECVSLCNLGHIGNHSWGSETRSLGPILEEASIHSRGTVMIQSFCQNV